METVTFDSNVWESIVDETKLRDDLTSQQLHELIKGGKIKPYFFEGIVILENIPRLQRKKHISNYSPGNCDIVLNSYLEEKLPEAFELGFTFLKFPRIGIKSHKIIQDNLARDEKYSLADRIERSQNCARFIESLGAGKSKLHDGLDGGYGLGIIMQSKNDKSLSSQQYSKRVGEWADGDAVSAHYGYGIDYFCTNDKAGNAGAASVFHQDNRQKLFDEYGVNVLSPVELIAELA